MNERNAHPTEPTSREESADPAGYEQSISPLGEVPPAGESTTPAEGDASIADRVGHDPSNLGNDIPNQGDDVHSAPMNTPIGKAPAM